MLAAAASVIAPPPEPIVAQEREALVARGRALFLEKGCHGCHTIGNVGRPIGPDLSHVGGTYGEDELARWLSPSVQEPTPGKRSGEPESVEREQSPVLPHMPTPRLSESEARALAAYLASLS